MVVKKHALFNDDIQDDQDEITLGGRGPGIEFCIFCNAIRVSIILLLL